MTTNNSLTIFAPAKINLNLYVTRKRDDGYHTLDSLVSFVDVGDQITISPAESFSFTITGPFADGFSAAEQSAQPGSSNIVVRAAYALAVKLNKELNLAITLTKNLPLAGGIGGGSADAAATLWGLMEFWRVRPQAIPDLTALMLSLGADVPVCLACRPVIMRGIGEELSPPPPVREMPIVLVNPLKESSTAAIFRAYQGPYRPHVSWPSAFTTHDDFLSFLGQLGNDLTPGAIKNVPEIATIIEAIGATPHCRLARMSGSGATCFGLFDTDDQAQSAARALKDAHPAWWVETGVLGRPVRY